ncbi:MAG: alpha-galactosidase [Clostridia bacterium]|nr:alpha-galactosidase [Clostridia bacterium]
MILNIEENGLFLNFELEQGKPVWFLHMGAEPMSESPKKHKELYTMLEIQATGESRVEHFGLGPCGTFPGGRMNYVDHKDERNELGRVLEIHTKDEKSGLSSRMIYQFYDGISIVRCRHMVKNEGAEEIGLETVSSFVQTDLGDEQEDDLSLLIPHNAWQEEIQWKETPVNQLGYHTMSDLGMSSKRIQIRNIGSWSAGEYLPLACLRNSTKGTMEFWQIEHNGAWNWEIQERDRKLALEINGPDEINHHWWKSLKPGESFETIPVAVGCVKGGVNETFAELTRYRRAIRRINNDNKNLPVIFNDYMNCLWGDPTTEKELPIIDAVAAIGCEYFCIDAGWYTDENWWYKVGEWQPSDTRFPNGMKEVTDYIHSKGMIPGIWLEIEVMGTQCAMVDQVDKSWFFQRHGKAALDRDRYQLDFRNPEVRAYTRSVVDRLIKDYGIGYFKIDYNINAGIGTEYQADSPGEGLLGHNRAYLEWLDEIFAAYPEVVIENCSSGGMRMDYAMLSRYSIQSTSDQTDYLKYASIAANAPSALTPEQAAIWSYPLSDSTREQTIFNCVSSCLLRIHQSGHMGVLAQDKKDIVKEELGYYKTIRKDICRAVPFWPLGLAKDGDDWMSLGLEAPDKKYLAVWKIKGEKICRLPMEQWKGQELQAKVAFPAGDDKCRLNWKKEEGVLEVELAWDGMARILEIYN